MLIETINTIVSGLGNYSGSMVFAFIAKPEYIYRFTWWVTKQLLPGDGMRSFTKNFYVFLCDPNACVQRMTDNKEHINKSLPVMKTEKYIPQLKIVFFIAVTDDGMDIWIVWEYLVLVDELLHLLVNNRVSCAWW